METTTMGSYMDSISQTVQGFGFRVQCSGLGFRVQCFRFRVCGFGIQIAQCRHYL